MLRMASPNENRLLRPTMSIISISCERCAASVRNSRATGIAQNKAATEMLKAVQLRRRRSTAAA